MNDGLTRRLAKRLARHAARVLPGARSPWAEAMRRELDYIEDDPAAARWAFGCLLASYRTRLAEWPRAATGAWRQVAVASMLLLLGFALHDNAEGQTQQPAIERTVCDQPDAPPQSSARRPADVLDPSAQQPDTSCADRNAPSPLGMR